MAILVAAGAAEAQRPDAPIGRNAVGETCRLRAEAERRDRDPFEMFGIYCDGWEQRSAFLTRVPAGGQSLEALLNDSGWARSVRTGLQCHGRPQTVPLANGQAVTESCTRLDGGWPQRLVAAQAGGRTYLGQFIPSVLPLLGEAIATIENPRRAPPGPENLTQSMRAIEAALGPEAKAFGATDIGSYALLQRLALLANQAEEFEREEGALRNMLALQERVLGIDAFGMGPTVSRLASAVSKQGRLEEATRLYARAEPLMASYPPASVENVIHLGFRASHEVRTGRTRPAAATYDQVVRIVRENYEAGSSIAIYALQQATIGYLALSRFEDGERTGREALAGAEATFGAVHPTVRTQLRNLSLVLEGRRRFNEAADAARRAASISETLFGEAEATAIDFGRLGEVEAARGRFEQALPAFRKGVTILVANARSVESKRFPMAGYLDATLRAAEQARGAAGPLVAEMFEASQLVHRTAADRAVTLMAARLGADDPSVGQLTRQYQDAVSERQGAREELGRILALAPQSRDGARQRELEARFQAASARTAQLEQQIQAANPRYARLTAPRPEPVAAVQAALDPDEALVHIVSGPSQTFVILVRREGVYAHRAELPRAQLAQMVGSLRRSVDFLSGGRPDFDLANAHQLYLRLFAPLAGQLAGIRHIAFIPTGALASLPVSVLVMSPPPAGQADYGTVEWFARRFSVSVLPSVRNFTELRRTRGAASASAPFFGMGAPTLGAAPRAQAQRAAANPQALADACIDGERINQSVLRSLPALPEAAEELKIMAAALNAPPSSVLTGAAATKARLRASSLNNVRTLAFATHGILPSELGCNAEPGLVLTPAGGDDGFLRASEIAQLNLNADFVVLSGCNTAGPGGRLGGESLAGLAQAFVYAGARALLASHWAVASLETAILTTTMFEAYEADRAAGRAAALQAAQLRLIGIPRTAHPVYWAPFVLVGDRL